MTHSFSFGVMIVDVSYCLNGSKINFPTCISYYTTKDKTLKRTQIVCSPSLAFILKTRTVPTFLTERFAKYCCLVRTESGAFKSTLVSGACTTIGNAFNDNVDADDCVIFKIKNKIAV